jgi:HPt (histidine-containing phosphotransfer) domain-containing protein
MNIKEKARNYLIEIHEDEELADMVIAEAVKCFPEYKKDLFAALQNGDMPEAERLIHSFTGALRNMGLDDEAAMALEMEKELSEGHQPEDDKLNNFFIIIDTLQA